MRCPPRWAHGPVSELQEALKGGQALPRCNPSLMYYTPGKRPRCPVPASAPAPRVLPAPLNAPINAVHGLARLCKRKTGGFRLANQGVMVIWVVRCPECS